MGEGRSGCVEGCRTLYQDGGSQGGRHERGSAASKSRGRRARAFPRRIRGASEYRILGLDGPVATLYNLFALWRFLSASISPTGYIHPNGNINARVRWCSGYHSCLTFRVSTGGRRFDPGSNQFLLRLPPPCVFRVYTSGRPLVASRPLRPPSFARQFYLRPSRA